MENRKLLIVGIDPGITTAYAVLDIGGNLLHLESSKQLDLNSLISKTVSIGKAILAGTDKMKAPDMVKTFATKLGARVISPDEDLRVEEKRKMTVSHNLANEHQSDALASALFAHRQAKPLLDKIGSFAEKNGKLHIKDKIKELVITKKISIRAAVDLIEQKDEESGIIKKVIEERKLSESDFLKIYDKLKMHENELKIVKMYNNKLKKQIDILAGRLNREKPKSNPKLDDFRRNRMMFLEGIIKSREREIEHLKLAAKNLNGKISNIGRLYILKKLDNLGIGEFEHKNRILNIQRNDILLVDNPNVISDSLIGMLKGMISIIVYKMPVSKKIEKSLPFIFIDAKCLKIDEDRHFGFIEKNHFETEKNKIDWVKKIVEDYRLEMSELQRHNP